MTYKYKPMREKYGLVIDWETSGSTWGGDSTIQYQGVSVGLVVFDTQTLLPIDQEYIEIKFDETKYSWSEGAEKVHGLSREHLEANGLTNEEAVVKFMTFFMKYFSPDDFVLVLGHNRAFDVAFTEQLLKPHGIMFNTSITALDTSVLGYMTIGLHKSDDLIHALGIPDRDAHNALDDALIELEIYRILRTMFLGNGLGSGKTPDWANV